MPHNEPKSSLRQRAEEIAREKEAQAPDNIETLSSEEIRRMVHELRVHQIELEMQNEELRQLSISDITERKQAEASLLDTEWKFKALFEKSPIGVAYHAMIYDNSGKPIDYRFLDVNETYKELTGVDPRGKTVTQAFPGIENDSFDWIGTYAHVARTGESIRFEQFLESNGRWYDCVGYQYKPDHFVAAFIEITKRKAHEAEIERLNRLYLALSQVNQLITRVKTREELLDGVCRMLVQFGQFKMVWIGWLDPMTRAVKPVAQHGDVGEFLKQITVCSDDSTHGRGPTGTAIREARSVVCNDFIHDNATKPWHEAGARQGFGSSSSFPVRSDGVVCGALTVYAGEVGFFCDKEILLFEEVAMDVSFALDQLEKEKQRQHAEEALRMSEAQKNAILNGITTNIALVDKDLKILWANKAAANSVNKQREDLLGHPCYSFWGDPAKPCENCPTIKAFHTKQSEHRIVHSPNGKIWDEGGEPVFDAQGNVIAVVEIAMDITARKQAEDQIKKLSSAVEQSPACIVITDLTGAIEYVNPSFTRITGYTLEEVRGQNARLLKGDKTSAEEYRRLWESISQGREWRGEFHNRKKNGEFYWESASISPIVDSDGHITHFLAVKEDITERKTLEEQFRQAQKLESIGQLAGGVAHDFNNILAVTMMRLSFLQKNSSLDSDTREMVADMTMDIKRAASLTRQLLLFSRRSVIEVELLDLNELVSNLLKMVRRLIGEHITVRFDYREALPAVKADAMMLEQVIMNLSVNARDAMPKGGGLTINIEPVQVDEERGYGNITVPSGQFVCLSVTDTGCGMDETTLKRIFEPFFTTKEAGKGTGLGLATVHGIVAQHKGWVEVESELGRGTTFKVFLPATKEGRSEPTQIENIAVIRGHETILLVEDETNLRQMVAKSLRQIGYAVLEADDGQTAMMLWQEHEHRIDLLFSDMRMPGGMTGLDLAERLKDDKHSLKVIISSGYNVEMAGEGRPNTGGIVFLQKPFEFEVLTKTIRDCLDRV